MKSHPLPNTWIGCFEFETDRIGICVFSSQLSIFVETREDPGCFETSGN